ncbi:MAG: dockerin type I domain-containing protein, partial [Bacteroidetes bacterium]|nr:dockerin type I domain-containing protein [Bacteroidota bacterium]
ICGNASSSYIDPGLQQFRRNMIMMDTSFFLLTDDLKGSDTLDYEWLLHCVDWKLYPNNWSYLQPQRNNCTFSQITGGWRSNTLGQQLSVFPLFTGYSASIDTFRYVPEGKPEGGYNTDLQFYNYGFKLKQSLHAKNANFRNLLVASDSSQLNVLVQNDSTLTISGDAFSGEFTARFRQSAENQEYIADRKCLLFHEYDSTHWSLWYGGGKRWTDSHYTLKTNLSDLLMRRSGNHINGKYWNPATDTIFFNFPDLAPVFLIDSIPAAVYPSGALYYTVIPQGEHRISFFDSSDYYNNYTVQGFITYANSINTPLAGVTVYLCDTLNIKLDSTSTATNGFYRFLNVAQGSYTFKESNNSQSGGINSTDALAVLKHFVHLQFLHGIYLAAADADGNNFVNSLDALYIQKRFIGMVSHFPAGDWMFEHSHFQVTGDMILSIKGICTGDVNGSYIPAAKR